MDSASALGDRLRSLREQRRWTQRQVADALGVSVKTVSNWESGRNDPRSSIGALEKLFGANLSGVGVEVEPADLVEVALRQSVLVEWRQDAVLSEYKRHLHQQAGESTTLSG